MGTEYKDYYKILGVERGAAKEDIAKSFKKLARKYHPDLNPGDTAAEEHFKDVNEAYEVLKDDEKRKLYDQLGPDWQNAQQFGGGNPFGGFGGGGGRTRYTFNGQDVEGGQFSDFFETLFGGGGRRGGFGDSFGGFSRTQAGRDMEAEVRITLEESVTGCKKSLGLQTGEGQKRLDVTIPAGIAAGKKLRLAGRGYPAPGGGPSGDLYLRIAYEPHPLFQVEGNDLLYEAELDPWQAVLGAKIMIPTLEGTAELTIPAGTGSGRKMRLRGKGLGAGVSRGDLYVRIAIRVPSVLTDKQRELWEALAAEAQTK